MRLNYSEDEDFPGQFRLWQANCTRALRSKAGQAALRELEAALVDMPFKRLANELFVEPSGEMCALGALAVHRRMKNGEGREQAVSECATIDAAYDTADYGHVQMELPRLVAWKIVEQNDIMNDDWSTIFCEGPNQFSLSVGYFIRIPTTPELRYERVLEWVRSNIITLAPPDGGRDQ